MFCIAARGQAPWRCKPLSNPGTQHVCVSAGIAQGSLSPLCSTCSRAANCTPPHELSRRRGCSPGWSAARVHSPTVSGLLRRSTQRPQVVPAWSCAFIRHPELITCRLIDGIAEWLCWLRRMFPVAARHAARLSMITVNGLHHWGGTGRALEHRSHAPARPRV